MHLIKAMLFLSLLQLTACMIAMDEPCKHKENIKPQAIKKSYLEDVIEKALDDVEDFNEQMHQAVFNHIMAPYRKKFETLAQIVCTDLKIENGTRKWVQAGTNAVKGSLQNIAAEKFILLVSALDYFENMNQPDRNEFSDMLANKKPIEIDRLKIMLKSSK